MNSGGTGMHAMHAQRVLRRQRGDRRRGKAAQRGDRLDVRLDARAAAGIGAGDDQHPARASDARPPARRGPRPRRSSRTAESTTSATMALSSPSAITRTSGSVPLSRISTRPVPFSRASASRIAACTRFSRSGEMPVNRTFFSRCGSRWNTCSTSDAGRSCCTSTASTCKRRQQAVAGGGEIGQDQVAGLLAADIDARARACAPRHSGRRPWCGAASGRSPARCRSSPRLDITVATMPPPRSVPA